MRTSRKPKKIKQDPKTCAVTILFSESEMELLNGYLKRMGVRSRSSFVRKLVMKKVLSEISENPISLFEASKFPYE